MTARIKRRDTWTAANGFVLKSAEVVERGKMACYDTTLDVVRNGVAAVATLVPIGYWAEDKTGDGTATVKIDLFDEMRLQWWDNDPGAGEIAAADVMNTCYVLDETSVTKTSSGNSVAGRVMKVDATDGVLVQQGLAVTGPSGDAVAAAAGGVATRAALKALGATARYNGMLVLVRTDNSLWRFDSASTLVDDAADALAQEPDAGTGCWIRADKSFILKVPVAFGMADHDTILTMQEGQVLRLGGLPYWEVTVAFAGGSSSSIGIAASVTGYDTAGDLLGGAAGDVAATLGAGVAPGTIGPKLDTLTEIQAFMLVEGDLLTYEEITSAFTSGSGFACFPVFFDCAAPATP